MDSRPHAEHRTHECSCRSDRAARVSWRRGECELAPRRASVQASARPARGSARTAKAHCMKGGCHFMDGERECMEWEGAWDLAAEEAGDEGVVARQEVVPHALRLLAVHRRRQVSSRTAHASSRTARVSSETARPVSWTARGFRDGGYHFPNGAHHFKDKTSNGPARAPGACRSHRRRRAKGGRASASAQRLACRRAGSAAAPATDTDREARLSFSVRANNSFEGGLGRCAEAFEGLSQGMIWKAPLARGIMWFGSGSCW